LELEKIIFYLRANSFLAFNINKTDLIKNSFDYKIVMGFFYKRCKMGLDFKLTTGWSLGKDKYFISTINNIWKICK
jgi:hypothetical protein